jgi:uncharacterized protein related to proFAR isomerase
MTRRRRSVTPLRSCEQDAAEQAVEEQAADEQAATGGSDLTRWIGVIDLKAFQAVQAVGGLREQYPPRRTFVFPDGRRVAVDGDPGRLLDNYLRAGVGGIYVADLDAITSGQVQANCLDALVEPLGTETNWFLDPGVSVKRWPRQRPAIESLMRRTAGLHLVVATECCDDVDVLGRLADEFPAERIVVSFDYRDRRWMSTTTTESQWFRGCEQYGVRTVIGLDLAAVGSGRTGRTETMCQRIRRRLPDVELISGGGVGDRRDVDRLIAAGADRVLVASLFSDDA